jgi:hypothetical protein
MEKDRRILSHPRYSKWAAYFRRNLSKNYGKRAHAVISEYTRFGLEDRACVLCGHDDYTLVSSRDRFGFALDKRICNHCGLVQTNPRLKEAFHAVFYKNMYRPLYKGGKKGVDYPKMTLKQNKRGRGITAFLQASLPQTDFSRYAVFEIGCSNGGVLQAMQPHFREVAGCDLDEDGIAWGKQNLGLDLTVAAMPETLAQAAPRVVILSHVLEHVYDPLATLRRLRALVGSEDLIYVGVPGMNLVKSGAYGHDLATYFHIGHVTDFTEGTFRAMAARAGFEVVVADESVDAILRKADREELPWRRSPADSVQNILDIEATRPRKLGIW